MRQSAPMRWIEQIEARQVMTDAIFQQAPKPSWRELARQSAADWLPRMRDRLVAAGATEWAMPQLQPVPVRVSDRREPPARDDDYGYYC